MFSFSIFVLLAVVQAERPDTSCLLQLSEPKPQLLAVESGPTLFAADYQCTSRINPEVYTQNGNSGSFPPGFLNNCNGFCQSHTLFDTLFTGSNNWVCWCCIGTAINSNTNWDVYEVATISNVVGDPHIKTLDGIRYTLLSQGTFSLWHFSGVEAEWKGEVKKVGVDWEVFTHYSGHQAFTKGLLLVDNSGGSHRQALEITARDCQWKGRKGSEWIAVQNGDSLSVLDGQDYVSSFIVTRKDGPKGHNLVRLNMQTKDGPTDVAVLSLSCRPQHHINLQMVMNHREDQQFVDGELKVARKKLSLLGTSTDAEFRTNKNWKDLGGSAAAAAYLRTVDEASKMSVLQISSASGRAESIASCSKAEENQAKETCSKHLGAYVDQRNADNAAFFDDCVFDLCHGAGESAAEIAAELLASNQAIQTMTS
ncbi:unnamed protein product [Cladocopium goreaui]|uniref:Deoxynucleoside triphosphate triphosphohydrolase SAMHD1 n=1 Tax=Cladocopium goreaui TaxID=2562237 RepID=A0A9P1CEZ9_9DINO|nr:unnamed protein product [Cladocopium goreaui]